MLNTKRSRSKSKSKDEEFTKKPKIEDSLDNTNENLNQKVFTLENSNKIVCKICQKDISKSIKILCAVCPDLLYCIECLVFDKPHDGKINAKHDYHVVDKLHFPIFTHDWSASEELILLSGNYFLA